MKKLSTLLLLLLFVAASCDDAEFDPIVAEEAETEEFQDDAVDDIDPRSLEERTTR